MWACPSDTEDAMPEFRLARPTRRTDIQPFVEKACMFKSGSPERHARAGADQPGRTTICLMSLKECRIEIDALKSPAEAPEELKGPLRWRCDFGRQNKPRHAPYLSPTD